MTWIMHPYIFEIKWCKKICNSAWRKDGNNALLLCKMRIDFDQVAAEKIDRRSEQENRGRSWGLVTWNRGIRKQNEKKEAKEEKNCLGTVLNWVESIDWWMDGGMFMRMKKRKRKRVKWEERLKSKEKTTRQTKCCRRVKHVADWNTEKLQLESCKRNRDSHWSRN